MGGANGSWTEPNNWNPPGVPVGSIDPYEFDTAIFSSPNSITVGISGSQSIYEVKVESDGVSVTFADGGSGTLSYPTNPQIKLGSSSSLIQEVPGSISPDCLILGGSNSLVKFNASLQIGNVSFSGPVTMQIALANILGSSTIGLSEGSTLFLTGGGDLDPLYISGNTGTIGVLKLASGVFSSSVTYTGFDSILNYADLTSSGNIYNLNSISNYGTWTCLGGVNVNSVSNYGTWTCLGLVGNGNISNYGTMIMSGSGSQLSEPDSFIQSKDAIIEMDLSNVPYLGYIVDPNSVTLAGTLSLTGTSSIQEILIYAYGNLTGKFDSVLLNGFSDPSCISYLARIPPNYDPGVVYNGGAYCRGNWVSDSSDLWNNSSNWDQGCVVGTIPGGGDVAHFGSGSQNTIDLGSFSPYLNILQFMTPTSYAITGTNTIVFETVLNILPSYPHMIVLDGAQTVSCNIAGSSSSTILNVQIHKGASLTFGSLSQVPKMTNFQEVIFLEAPGQGSSQAIFDNYGTIGSDSAPIETITVKGGVLTNFEHGSIQANTLDLSGGKLINSDQITVTNLTVESGGTYQARMHSQELFGLIHANSIHLDGHLIT